MNQSPFLGQSAQPSKWGYGWSTNSVSFESSNIPQRTAAQANGHAYPNQAVHSPADMNDHDHTQLAHMPAALLSNLKREKKPFTYTPGGVDLSEVLSARLQKRIDRKKKHSMERLPVETANHQTLPVAESQKQVLVMPTYNSSLNMYSMENALEALEVQAELALKNEGSSSLNHSMTLPRNHTFRFDDAEPRNVTQSKAFKVLQIITDTEEEQPKSKSKNEFRDEMRFTGIRDSKTIPSKFFHTLQKITGTDEEESEETQPMRTNNGMEFVGQANTGVFDNRGKIQSYPLQRTEQMTSASISQPVNQVHQFSPYRPAVEQQSDLRHVQVNGPLLKRPAAFLPMNKTSGIPSPYVPYQSPVGSLKKAVNPRMGTDL